LIEDISYDAPENSGKRTRIDVRFVQKKLKEILVDEDLSHYVL